MRNGPGKMLHMTGALISMAKVLAHRRVYFRWAELLQPLLQPQGPNEPTLCNAACAFST